MIRPVYFKLKRIGAYFRRKGYRVKRNYGEITEEDFSMSNVKLSELSDREKGHVEDIEEILHYGPAEGTKAGDLWNAFKAQYGESAIGHSPVLQEEYQRALDALITANRLMRITVTVGYGMFETPETTYRLKSEADENEPIGTEPVPEGEVNVGTPVDQTFRGGSGGTTVSKGKGNKLAKGTITFKYDDQEIAVEFPELTQIMTGVCSDTYDYAVEFCKELSIPLPLLMSYGLITVLSEPEDMGPDPLDVEKMAARTAKLKYLFELKTGKNLEKHMVDKIKQEWAESEKEDSDESEEDSAAAAAVEDAENEELGG